MSEGEEEGSTCNEEDEPNYATEGPGDDTYYDYDEEEWRSDEDDQQ